MRSAEYCRMGEIEDVGTMGRKHVGRLLRMGAMPVCGSVGGGGISGGGMGYHGKIFVENHSGGRRSRDGRPDLVGWGRGEESHR